MKILPIKILDRTYQISCSNDEQEILQACAALVDSRMKNLKDIGKLQSTEKIAIMVALTLAKDFLNAGGVTMEENIKKIDEITNLIEKALEPQNNLF